MRLVVALGGNALLRCGEPAEAETQHAHVREVASALAALAAEHELVVTHGNGPQVSLLALEAAAYPDVAPYPLDVLGAETQGMIGYLLVQALGQELPEREVTSLLTQVLVDAGDPAFGQPTKPTHGDSPPRTAGRSRPTEAGSGASSRPPSRARSSSWRRSGGSWTRARWSSAPAAAASRSCASVGSAASRR